MPPSLVALFLSKTGTRQDQSIRNSYSKNICIGFRLVDFSKMEFNLNCSLLNAVKRQEEKITHREIISVFYGDERHTTWDSLPQYFQFGIYYYLIGFGDQKRFLQIVLHSDGQEIQFIDIKVADLEDIVEDFFK